ncbi:MAG: DoxX family protein [Saprospiraceae bacterium]|nr:DoxX family protein [Saprospiraceae bacterium]
MSFLKNLYSTKVMNSDWVALLLRVIGGGFMLTHGYPKFQKLLSGNFEFGDPLGLGVGPSLFLTVFAEFFCGLLLLVGLGTRLSSIPLFITMFVAAFVVHGDDPFARKEKALMYLLVYLALFLFGGGKYSIDNLIKRKQ